MRASLAVLNEPRDATREKDSAGVNCFLEEELGVQLVVKRPGLVDAYATAGTIGQGIFIYPGATYEPGVTVPVIFSLVNDVLYEGIPLGGGGGGGPAGAWVQI